MQATQVSVNLLEFLMSLTPFTQAKLVYFLSCRAAGGAEADLEIQIQNTISPQAIRLLNSQVALVC